MLCPWSHSDQQNSDLVPGLSECHCPDRCTQDLRTRLCPRLLDGILKTWKFLEVGTACFSHRGSGWENPACSALPRPQPYRTLKESDSAEGEAESPEQRAREPVGPAPAPPDRAASVDLLEDIFSSLDMEVPLQPLGQAKSLEDLRTPKDLREQSGTFDYQVRWGRGRACWDWSSHTCHRSPTCQREKLVQGPRPMFRVSLTANPARRASGHPPLSGH